MGIINDWGQEHAVHVNILYKFKILLFTHSFFFVSISPFQRQDLALALTSSRQGTPATFLTKNSTKPEVVWIATPYELPAWLLNCQQ